MRKLLSIKVLSLIMCIVMIASATATSFASSNDTINQNQTISQSDVMKMVEKIQPFIKYENGIAKLTTNDYEKIGISKNDLIDVQKGIEIGNKSIKENSKNIQKQQSGTISAQWSTQNGLSDYKITFSSFEVKSVIAVGLTAGTIAAVASFLVSGSVLIFGVTLTYTAVYGIISATILWMTSMAWLITDGAAVTITIPKSLFITKRGTVNINNGKHSASKKF